VEQREAQLYQQQLQAQQAQREFEEQQRLQIEQQRLAQEQLARDHYQRQTEGRIAELERENLNARAQYEQDQLMLEQYDRVNLLPILYHVAGADLTDRRE
jgi:hypothetical protein